MAFVKDRDEPIYTISIAAKLVRPAGKATADSGVRTADRGADAGVRKPDRPVADQKPIHAQTLRMYDRLGLVKPQKVGKNRFYSDRDIERLQRIQHFTQDIGINLAGVAFILALADQMTEANLPLDRIEAMFRSVEEQLIAWSETGDNDA